MRKAEDGTKMAVGTSSLKVDLFQSRREGEQNSKGGDSVLAGTEQVTGGYLLCRNVEVHERMNPGSQESGGRHC
jgi:hypothetical protein